MSRSSSPKSPSFSANLEKVLRKSVQQIFDNGNLEDLTVKRVRKTVEEKLGLEQDFLKNDSIWKGSSKAIIQSEVDSCTKLNAHAQSLSSQSAIEQGLPLSSKAQNSKDGKQNIKRASTEGKQPRKRRKKNSPDHEPSLTQGPQTLNEGSAAHTQQSKRSSSSSPVPETGRRIAPLSAAQLEPNNSGVEQSESEMSVLLDDEPRKRGRPSQKPKTIKSATSKGKKLTRASLDPEMDEIKRLQNWLVKCGIRKVWGAYLATFESPKAKTHHLKEMLAEAGMRGRFSEQKAAQIKEERELQADLEAVQEGAKQWGRLRDSGEADDGNQRPRRQLAKGLEGLDFLNDDDGEETD